MRSRAGVGPQPARYAHDHPAAGDLAAAIRTLRPTALIGLSGQGGLFTGPVLGAMREVNPRPIVFAMSNPTSQAECTAGEAYDATGGTVVFASGSPFEPVEWAGRRYVVGQANNAYVFPGIGLGVVAGGIRRVTDGMFLAAADALAGTTSTAELAEGSVYPAITRMRDVSVRVAEAAIVAAGGPADRGHPGPLLESLRQALYEPEYRA